MDNDNEQDEFIEAPEDDEFGDYEAPENDAPEAVQAMNGSPNWVFPDLVRVQSSNNIIDGAQNVNASADVIQQPQSVDTTVSSRNNIYSVNGGAIPRTSQRVLDPPDVSLLSLNSSSSIGPTNQQNTLDLCSSTRSNSKSFFQSSLCNLKNGNSATSSNNVSSPNSTGSSSSASSSISTNLSGLILSNSSSSCSSQQNVDSRNSDPNLNATSNGIHENNYLDFNNQTSSFLPSVTLASNQRMTNLEREIRTLEMQKALLQQQLVQKDGQINDLQRTLSSVSTTTSNLEETVVRRINDSFDRLNSNIENTMGTFERRIEHLESCFKSSNGILSNGKNHSKAESNELNSPNSSHSLAQTLTDLQSRLCEQQRQEMCSLFRNILTSAVREIDSFAESSFHNDSNNANINGR